MLGLHKSLSLDPAVDKHFFQRLRLSVSSGISPRKAASWFDNNFSHIQTLRSANQSTIEVVPA
jgi:hypothetical protein